MGRETKTFRKRVESPPVSPHLEIVPTNLPLFFLLPFFAEGGICAPLHTPALISQQQRFMSQRRHCILCNNLALHTARDKRGNKSQPPAGFPSQLSVGSGGEGMEFWEFCASPWCLKSITPWLPSGGKGGTSFFDSDPTFYRCSLFSSTVYVLNSKTILSPYLKSTILKEHTDSTLCKTQKPSPCLKRSEKSAASWSNWTLKQFRFVSKYLTEEKEGEKKKKLQNTGTWFCFMKN